MSGSGFHSALPYPIPRFETSQGFRGFLGGFTHGLGPICRRQTAGRSRYLVHAVTAALGQHT